MRTLPVATHARKLVDTHFIRYLHKLLTPAYMPMARDILYHARVDIDIARASGDTPLDLLTMILESQE